MTIPRDVPGPARAAGHDARGPGARLERLRQELPAAIASMATFAVDNPGDVAIAVAGMLVLDHVMVNLVRPRTPVMKLATMVVLMTAAPCLLKAAADRGIISFRLREPDGSFTSLRDVLREASGAAGRDTA